MEAISAGLPVIATLYGGIRECIDDKNGMLDPVADAKKKGDAICEIAKNIDDYDRSEIRKNSRSHFAPQVITKQLVRIFEKVMESLKIMHN